MKRLLKIGSGFTLVEILVVLVIITILAGLVLSVAGNVMNSARKSRAAGEVAAIDMALSRFHVDNGFYPTITNINTVSFLTNNFYYPNPGSTTNTNYILAGRALFLALMGRTMYDYAGTNTNNYRQYYNDLKATRVASEGVSNSAILNPDPTISTTYTTNTFTAGSYIIDPFQNAYGYYYNENAGSGITSLFSQTAPDVWSTAGETNSTFVNTNTYLFLRWIHNWPQNAMP
ncbi:MAG: prepilin-type N-terminal cleavage/methylation domain-containing protein [Chthoniobacteraceae bacterium]